MEQLFLGKPDHYWLRHFANYLNTEPKDSPLYEKAQKSFLFMAKRIALKRKAEIDAQKWFKKQEEKIYA